MALDLSLTNVLGLTAGVLILALGVLLALVRPRSPQTTLLAAFAIADGASTAAFRWREIAEGPAADLGMWLYMATFLPFTGLLVVVGLRVPEGTSALARRATPLVLGATTAATLLYLARPSLYWSPGPTGPVYTSLGVVAQALFLVAVAIVLARLLVVLAGHPSETHRLQAALVLGGFVVGYAPLATVSTASLVDQGLWRMLSDAPPAILLARASYLLTTALAIAAFLVALLRRRGKDRTVVLACTAIVLLIAGASFFTGAERVATLRVLALLVYPFLLAYAVLRYGVLDLGPNIRWLAAGIVAAVALGGIVVVGEFALGNLIERALTATGTSGLGIGLVSSALSALLAVPLARWARKGVARLFPAEAEEGYDARRLDVYAHAVGGVLADGTLTAADESVLARMREALGVTPEEHAVVLTRVRRAAAQ